MQALTVAVPQSARRTPRPTSSSSDFGSRRSSSFGSSQTSTGDHLTPRLLARSLSLRARELANQPGDSTGGPSKTGSRRQSSFSRALTAEEELVVSGGSAVSQDEGGRKEPDSLERVSEGDESEKRSHLHTPRDCQTSSRSKLSEERHSGGMALGQFEVEFGSPLEQRRSLDGSSDGGVVISDSESSLRASLEGDAELKAFAESVNAVLPGPHGAVSSVGGPMGVGAGPVPTMAAGVVATEIPQSLVPPQNVEEPRLEESGGDSGRPADVSEGAAGVEKAGDVEEQSFQQGGLDEGSNDEKSGKEGGDLESAAGQVDGKNAPVMLRKGGASGEVDECEVETSGSAVHSPSTLSGTLDLQSDVLIAEEKWNDVSNDADDVPVLTSEAGRLVAAEENEVQAKQLEETTTRVEQKLETGGNESGGEEGSDKADSKALEGLVEEGRSDEVEERERSAEDANPEENGVLEEVGTSREGAVLSTEEIQKPSGETSPEQGIRKEGGVESETGADGEDKEERIPKGLEAEQVQENDLETERVGRQDEVVQDEQSASGPTIGEEPEPPVEGGGAELGPEHSGFGKVSAEERGKPARMLNETRGAELSLGEVALTEAGLASESGDASAVAINAVAEMNESDGAEGSKNEDASTSKLIEQSRAAERPQFGGAVEGETPSLEDGEAPAAGAKRSGREKRGETVAAAGGTEKSKSVTAVERRDSYRGDKTATDDGDDVAGKMNEAHLGSVTAPNRVSPERKVRSPESQNAERIGEVAKDKHGDLAASVPSKKERNGRETDEPTAVATGAKAPGERFPVKKERKLVAGKKTREVPAGDSKSEAEKGDADVQGLKRVPVADEGFEGSQESIKEEDGPRKQGGETGLEKASRETFAVCAGQGGGVLCADEDEAESKAGTKTREESFERTEKGASEMTKTKKVTKDRRSDKELRHTGAIEHLEEGPDLTAGSVPAETEKVVEEASVAVGDQQSDGAGLPPKRESGVLIAGTEASTGVTTGTEGATETPKKDKKKKGKKHRERSETEGREAGTEQPESARVLDPEAVVDGTSGGQESRFNGVLSAVEEKAEVAAVTEISKREEREAKETSESPKKARKKKSRKIRTSSEKEGLKEAKEHLGSTAEDKSEAVQKAPVGTETADKQTGTPLAREEIGLSGSESVGKEGKRKKKSKTGKKKHKATEQGVETVGETDVIDAGSASVSRLDGTERGDNEADVQTVLSGAFVEAKGAENKPGVKNIRRNVSQESVEVVAWPEFDSDDTCQSPRGAEKSAMGSRDGFKPVAEGAAPTGPVTSANGADDVSEKLRLALAGRRGKRGSAGSLYYPEQAFGAADVSATGGEKSSQGGVSTDRESLADPDTVKVGYMLQRLFGLPLMRSKRTGFLGSNGLVAFV